MRFDTRINAVKRVPFVPFYAPSSMFEGLLELSIPSCSTNSSSPCPMTARCNQQCLGSVRGLQDGSGDLRNVSRPICILVILSCKIILRCVSCDANQASPVTSHMCVVHPQRIKPEPCRRAYSSVAWKAYKKGVQLESGPWIDTCFRLVHRCRPDRGKTIGLAVRKALMWRSSTALWSPSATLCRRNPSR